MAAEPDGRHVDGPDDPGTTIRLSHNAQRALQHAPPRLRGWSHLVAALVAVPLAVAAIVGSEPGTARLATTTYTGATVVMLVLSAGMHWRVRGPRATELWIRLDHTGIYLMIAAATSSVALLGLSAPWRSVTIAVAWAMAVIGLVVEWLPDATPRGFAHGMFLAAGWVMVLMVWELWNGPGGPAAVAWLLAGGVAYTLGAVVVALRRPDPSPAWFGYHEVWHLLVLVAVACHWFLVVHVLG